MKPECEKIEPLLSAYADGELAGAGVEEVRAHLLACADCRATLESFKAVDQLYAEAACEELSEGRWRSMMWNVVPRGEIANAPERRLTAGTRRIPMSIIGRRRVRWAGWSAGVLAAAGVLLVAGFMLFVGPKEPRLGNDNFFGGPKGLRLGNDNTCSSVELEASAEGYEANLTLPANEKDLLVIDIMVTQQEEDDSDS